jgi:hypothetical protein
LPVGEREELVGLRRSEVLGAHAGVDDQADELVLRQSFPRTFQRSAVGERIQVGVGTQVVMVRLHGLGDPVVERFELAHRLVIVVQPGNGNHGARPDRTADDRHGDAQSRLLLDHPVDVGETFRHREALEQLRRGDVPVYIDGHWLASPAMS